MASMLHFIQNRLEIESNALKIRSLPRFIKYLKPQDCDTDSMIIPESFNAEFGAEIPSKVMLEFPNGCEFPGQYKVADHSLSNVGSMLNAYKNCLGAILVICYNGNGKFMVNIMNHAMSEVEYGTDTTISCRPAVPQDTINGIGWKFVTRCFGNSFLRDGVVDIPSVFIKRFRGVLPSSVTIALNNGDLITGQILKRQRKLSGLVPLIRKKYIQQFDILMFTYGGNGHFDVCVFNRSKLEKSFPNDLIVIDSDSEDQSEGNGNHNEFVSEEIDEEMVDRVTQFYTTMTISNTDNSSHGVYIPTNITPNNRRWRAGEELILRTSTGTWKVGLVISNGRPRFSAGWNRFVRDNGVKLNNTLVMNLVEENEEVIGFEVEIQTNN